MFSKNVLEIHLREGRILEARSFLYSFCIEKYGKITLVLRKIFLSQGIFPRFCYSYFVSISSPFSKSFSQNLRSLIFYYVPVLDCRIFCELSADCIEAISYKGTLQRFGAYLQYHCYDCKHDPYNCNGLFF